MVVTREDAMFVIALLLGSWIMVTGVIVWGHWLRDRKAPKTTSLRWATRRYVEPYVMSNYRYGADGERAVLVNEIGVPDTCKECKGMSNACLFQMRGFRSVSCAMKNTPTQTASGETPMKRRVAPDGHTVIVPANDCQASPSLEKANDNEETKQALDHEVIDGILAADTIVDTLRHCLNDFREHGFPGELTEGQLKWITTMIIAALEREGLAIGGFK